MTPEVVPLAPSGPDARQLRRMQGVYAAGTVLWTVSLLVSLLGHDADVRQVLLLLALVAAFGLLWLWSAWHLWTTSPQRGGPAV
ncbi:hypothetical protein [Streptomyces tropicalis]|uniref:Integral membrane protein n=1 Tax=Streptomyces tropicalis TaxID=3034234 RepID=A0ABT6AA65_9ACTN|nr:hypothetical protein [Streptomyces tropicalis]MDF3301539.1 hypothetical protein [Streptomyces tropicalis]